MSEFLEPLCRTDWSTRYWVQQLTCQKSPLLQMLKWRRVPSFLKNLLCFFLSRWVVIHKMGCLAYSCCTNMCTMFFLSQCDACISSCTVRIRTSITSLRKIIVCIDIPRFFPCYFLDWASISILSSLRSWRKKENASFFGSIFAVVDPTKVCEDNLNKQTNEGNI